MIEVGMVVFLVLIALLVFFRIRKKKLANASSQTSNEPQNTVVQAPPVKKTDTPSEPVKPTIIAESAPAPKIVVPHTTKPSLLPEDSALKRHYVSQLRAMAITVQGACPSDASLRRHYLAEIAAEVERCSNDKAALAHLLQAYQETKKPVLVTVAEPAPVVETADVVETPEPVITETVTHTETVVDLCHGSKIPEDSALKRHYLTQIKAQAVANLTPCPTDSTLRRHYQSLLDNEIAKLLA